MARFSGRRRGVHAIFRSRVRKGPLKASQDIVDEKEEFQSVTSRGSNVDTVVDMGWYQIWLKQQLRHVPRFVREVRVEDDGFLDGNSLDTIFTAIENYTQANEGVSIDEIIQHLQSIYLFDRSEELLGPQRLLIFAVLGWRSMVYQAAFNVCSTQELAIHQDSDQPQSGLVFDAYKVSASLCDRPLSVLMKAFGNILPARSSDIAHSAAETTKLASSWLPLYPKETNAYLLHGLLRVHIRWVDSLALHLDYDKSSRTLSLFCYPSFCLDMLRSHGVIYAFASIDHSSMDPRGNREDISQLLREVLLSYRLLFGQSGPSRKLFRQTFKPSAAMGYQVDSLLPLICTKKQIADTSPWVPVDRPIYFTARDFPVLCERIELIAKELRDARPKSIGDLFRDRRDTLQYWTFWLVSIIGGASIILSIIQVVLQALQLMKS